MEENKRIFVYKSDEVITIKLYDVIDEPQYLESIFKELENAKAYQTIRIFINCRGGLMCSMIQMLKLMKNCEAQIHTYCTGDLASAATFILLQGDLIFIDEYSTVLFHEPSFGAVGKNNEILNRATQTREESEDLLEEYYGSIISEEEMSSLMYGSDLYMSGEELVKRMKESYQYKDKVSEW